MTQTLPLPLTAAMLAKANIHEGKPRYTSMTDWHGGQFGNEVDQAEATQAIANRHSANVEIDYDPQHQKAKSNDMVPPLTILEDLGKDYGFYSGATGRAGTVQPRQPYPAVGDGGGAPEWVPANAKTYLDFMNGLYYAGGAERAAIEIIADPSLIQSGTGLVFGQNTDPPGSIIGPALTDINVASATLVFDADYIVPEGSGLASPVVTLNDSTDANEVFYFSIFSGNSPDTDKVGGLEFGGYDSGVNSAYGASAAVISPYHSKTALTFSATEIALSFNGQDVVTAIFDPGPSTAVATRLLLGSYGLLAPSQAWTLRSITMYDPLPDNTGLIELSET